jgi:hypothetical protein
MNQILDENFIVSSDLLLLEIVKRLLLLLFFLNITLQLTKLSFILLLDYIEQLLEATNLILNQRSIAFQVVCIVSEVVR